MLRLVVSYALISRPTLAGTLALPFQPSPSVDAVAEQIRRTGARATPARIRVLQLLRDAPAALTHNEIESALGARARPKGFSSRFVSSVSSRTSSLANRSVCPLATG